MEDDSYKIISKPARGFYKDKGSKFISYAVPVSNEEEVKEQLEIIKKKHHDARHHCYAYAIGPGRGFFRMNDDGEPSGTAGKQIYGQILSYDVINVLIIVVRYFGGTKLGIRGLIDAYKTAASEALGKANILTRQLQDVYELHYDYPLMNKVMYILKEENLKQLDSTFEMDCKLTFSVRKKESQRIFDKFSRMHPLTIAYLRSE